MEKIETRWSLLGIQKDNLKSELKKTKL